MGSPTSDDDPTRRLGGPGGPGPGQGPSYPPPGQGPSYPPPGQGPSYSGQDSPTTRFPQPDDQRGQTAQFPQPGGYPPGAPAGPYQQAPYQQGPYGPGPYPPQGPYGPGPYPAQGPYPPQGPYGAPPPEGSPSGRSRRGLVIALIAGLVILAGVGAALVFAFTRDDGRKVAVDPSASATPSPASSSAAAPSTTESTSSAPPPSETAGDRTDDLLAAVPPDFTDCARAEPAGDGDVAAVDCGASATQPGPTEASFYLYDDPATLDSVFGDDATDIEAMPEGEDCTTAQGVLAWNDADGQEGGEVACTIGDEGLLIAWTDREFGIEGVVSAPGSTQEELAALAEWWRANSDFQG